MNQTTENFIQAMQEFIAQEPAKPIEYRLYYDEFGSPVNYTTEDLSGSYIVIDQHTYSLRSHKVRVINGQLVQQREQNRMVMRHSEDSGQACHPYSVAIIVHADHTQKQYWKLS